MNNQIRYPRLLAALTNKVWAIQPGHLNTLADTLYQASHGQIVPAAGTLNEGEEEPGIPSTNMAQVAVIPVHGVIGRHLSSMEAACGGCDLDAVEAALAASVEDDAIDAIVLHVDSPGGVTDGIDGAAAAVTAAAREKPVYAFTDSMMCSAAYWLCAGATQIHATSFADVGSIGVYMAWIDRKKWMESEGLDLRVIKAGRLKAMMLDGQMTAEGETHLQQQVDLIYDAFSGHVTSHRQGIDADSMQGQAFLGAQAQQLGLVDDVAESWEDFIQTIHLDKRPISNGALAQSTSTNESMSLLSSKKFAALSAMVTEAGFDVGELLAGETNPIADRLTAAEQAGAAKVLQDLEIEQGDHESPAAAIDEHYTAQQAAADMRADAAETKRKELAAAATEALGVDPAQLERSPKEALQAAVTRAATKQLAHAGHEPIEQPQDTGDDVTDIDVMDMATARTALAKESDPVRSKQIYSRIQQLKAAGKN